MTKESLFRGFCLTGVVGTVKSVAYTHGDTLDLSTISGYYAFMLIESYIGLYKEIVKSNLRAMSEVLDLQFHLAEVISRFRSLVGMDSNFSDCFMILVHE